ncbi:hypothetical protein Pcinc_006270 [Petrolisthes cinctipes]|uniref:Uncharacterized protein n=1 Tax=Petrolisthes cinctipes TaxID=88211 RepID=A0AAE1KYH2_PETCI|nr:hypothetical protein Pcinc_006270 [Petrolisthes cinctipes]
MSNAGQVHITRTCRWSGGSLLRCGGGGDTATLTCHSPRRLDLLHVAAFVLITPDPGLPLVGEGVSPDKADSSDNFPNHDDERIGLGMQGGT